MLVHCYNEYTILTQDANNGEEVRTSMGTLCYLLDFPVNLKSFQK